MDIEKAPTRHVAKSALDEMQVESAIDRDGVVMEKPALDIPLVPVISIITFAMVAALYLFAMVVQ